MTGRWINELTGKHVIDEFLEITISNTNLAAISQCFIVLLDLFADRFEFDPGFWIACELFHDLT